MNNQSLQDILDGMEISVEFSTDINNSSDSAGAVSTDVTASVTSSNVGVVGDSATTSEAELHQILSQSASITAQNAVNAQNQLTTTHQATTTKELRRFLLPCPKKIPRSAFEASLKTLTDIMTTIENLSQPD